MFGRSRDDEVSIAAFTGDLRANATIGRNQLFRLNGGPYLLCCFEKARMPALIDIIVDGADPCHIWPEARRARKVERKMGAQTAWFRRWLDEMPQGRFGRIGTIMSFRDRKGLISGKFVLYSVK